MNTSSSFHDHIYIFFYILYAFCKFIKSFKCSNFLFHLLFFLTEAGLRLAILCVLGWPWTQEPPASTSQVFVVTGVCYQTAPNAIFNISMNRWGQECKRKPTLGKINKINIQEAQYPNDLSGWPSNYGLDLLLSHNRATVLWSCGTKSPNLLLLRVYVLSETDGSWGSYLNIVQKRAW